MISLHVLSVNARREGEDVILMAIQVRLSYRPVRPQALTRTDTFNLFFKLRFCTLGLLLEENCGGNWSVSPIEEATLEFADKSFALE